MTIKLPNICCKQYNRGVCNHDKVVSKICIIIWGGYCELQEKYPKPPPPPPPPRRE